MKGGRIVLRAEPAATTATALKGLKVLMIAHRLELGGAQINMIELASKLQSHYGCRVTVFAAAGPLVAMVREKGLQYVEAPDVAVHPSPLKMRALCRLVKQERPDLLHAWDWWQYLDTLYGAALPLRLPMLVTDMMMSLTRILPMRIPVTLGVPDLVDQARHSGRRRATLIVPPVDVGMNDRRLVSGDMLRLQLGLEPTDCLLVSVSRLSNWMKSGPLENAISALENLGSRWPLHLLIVGEGAARPRLESMAARCNQQLGRKAIHFTGALVDPRPAYAAANIVLGMGGSSLRAMAFGQPVIIIGESGFASVFNEQTADSFFHYGMYGRANGKRDGNLLIGQIESLLSNPLSMQKAACFSTGFVKAHFSLEVVVDKLAGIYLDIMRKPPALSDYWHDALRSGYVYLRERRFLSRSRDRIPQDAVSELTSDKPITSFLTEGGNHG